MTRGERVIAFIERYCRVPDGRHVAKPLVLEQWQRRFILDIYDNPAGTTRAYLSIARKNGKTALIACLLLAHLVGPEARLNTQIVSGARSRKQAAQVFDLAVKMIRLNPALARIAKPTISSKTITGLTMNVEYHASSAEAGTAHGMSPVLAILDEVGQVRGPTDAFVEAIETSQGAHDEPLLIAISTQAPTEDDMFSRWIDDALSGRDPHIICHLYTAPTGCALDDRKAWAAANPGLGTIKSLEQFEQDAARAQAQRSFENSFRWLHLNQRIDADSPFVSRTAWFECGGPVADLRGVPVWCGLDLSATSDLTAFVMIGKVDGVWHVVPTFWLPAEGLREKARSDRVPYDQWRDDGHLMTCPGRSVDYEFVAAFIATVFETHDVRKIAFDRWGFRYLKPWLERAGLDEERIGRFDEFGQGFRSISPALRDVEAEILNGRLRHGGHPVLSMCAANSRVKSDPAGNRKLVKSSSTGRIDGMVAMTMAFGVAPMGGGPEPESFWETKG